MADVRGRAILERDDDVGLEVGIRLRSMLHEIRQPVATVLALAEAARGVTGASEELLEYLDRIEAQIQEIPSAASSVLEPPVGRVAEGTPPDVDEVVGSVVRDFALTWAGTLRRRGNAAGEPVRGSRPAVRRCVVNLVDNAARAAGPGGTVMVTVGPVGGGVAAGPSLGGNGGVRVTVEDDGPGFGLGPAGSGIGLVLTRRTVQALGGGVAAGRSLELGGALVALDLPLARGDREPSFPTAWTTAG